MTITLTPDQQRVYDGLLQFWKHGNGVATLKGYAGVGKTVLTAELVRAWVADQNKLVLVTASTNKAVAVLAAKMTVPVESMTIHAALGLKAVEHDDGSQTFVKDRASKLADFDLLVVDESSMLQDDLFAATLSSRHGCHVLFVGDPAQLAPVQEGSELSKAFDPAIVPVWYELTKIIRQAAGNPIIRWAHKLREWITTGAEPNLADLAAMLEPGDDEALSIVYEPATTMQQWTAQAHLNGYDTRILAYTNREVHRHNQCVHAILHPLVWGFAPGEPVMFYGFYERQKTVNSTPCTVRNSAMGKVESMQDGGFQSDAHIDTWDLTIMLDDGNTVCVPVPKDLKEFNATLSGLFNAGMTAKVNAKAAASPTDRAALWAQSTAAITKAWATKKHFAIVQHAYAMTIHKSQGSTFDTVLLDYDDLPHGRTDGETLCRLMYVAITRASKHLAVFVRGSR